MYIYIYMGAFVFVSYLYILHHPSLTPHTPTPPQKNSFQKEYHSSAFRPHEGEGAYARPLTAPFVVDTVDFGADAPVEKGLTVRSACVDGGGACGLGW